MILSISMILRFIYDLHLLCIILISIKLLLLYSILHFYRLSTMVLYNIRIFY
jgi:hypothetical protein